MSKNIWLVLCLVAVCGAASAQTYTADHIEVKMDPDREPLSLNHFQLTDNPDNNVGADSGTLVVTEQKTGLLSGGVTEAYDTNVGSTVGPSSGSLSPLVGSLSSTRAGFVSGDDKVQRVESVVNQNFIDDITRNDGKYNLMAASGYEPKGQVISAYETPQRNNKQLHLCTEDAPEDVVFSDSRPYRCDTEGQNGDGLWRTKNDGVRGGFSGDWDPVPRCQDGYDNDGDDYKDFPADNGCSSERDNTETVGEETQTCDPFIGKQDGAKVAFYDSGQGSSNPLGNGCNYEVQKTVDGTDVLETFRCIQQGDAKSAGGGNLELTNNVERAARDFCTAVSNRDNHLHSGSEIRETEAVRSVIFSYTKDNIPYSPKAENQGVSTSKTSPRANEFVEDTDFSPSTLKKRCARKTQTPGTDSIGGGDLVYEGGFTLRRCETVHHAENEYTNGDPHAASVWRSRGMADLGDGYERSDNSLEPIDVDRADSWVAARPGDSTQVISEGGGISDPAFFEGGFAGRCPGSGQWQYVTPSGPLYNTIDSSGIWRCGNPSQISVDFFKLNIRDYGEKHVGFRVTQEQVNQWKSTFSGLPGTPELKMDAACWPGRRNTLVNTDGSANTNLLTNTTVDLNADANTIAGLELKDPNLPADRYSCVYGFRQTNVNEGSLIPGNEASFSNGLLVEGLNNRGSISSAGVEVDLNTDIERVRRPDVTDDAMEGGDVREQRFLEGYNATNSDRVSTVSAPFKDYPSGGDGGLAIGRQQGSDRNPLSTYLSRN